MTWHNLLARLNDEEAFRIPLPIEPALEQFQSTVDLLELPAPCSTNLFDSLTEIERLDKIEIDQDAMRVMRRPLSHDLLEVLRSLCSVLLHPLVINRFVPGFQACSRRQKLLLHH